MRIFIIRHGDPYYPTDSLTEKGQREAELLGERLMTLGITHVYTSPLGRAKLTAKPFLDRSGLVPVELDWLREFPASLAPEFGVSTKLRPAPKKEQCPWNMPPEVWTALPDIFTPDGWRKTEMYGGGKIPEVYDRVCAGWDGLLASHGYTREGAYYRIGEGWEEKHEALALFCHLGLGNALLSHIMNLSLVAVWHTLFLPTTSVTTVFMEQHLEKPVAHARLISVGDTSHLYAGGEPVSASGLHTKEID